MNTLTPKQRQVAQLLVEAKSNNEIAEEAHMRLRTVKQHTNVMFRKFGINSGIKRVKLAVVLWRKMNTNECSSQN